MEYSLEQIGDVAEIVLGAARRRQTPTHATLITFSGDLGAGKTTLIQEIAKQVGVTDTLQSPTFVIYKRYATHIHPYTPQPPLKEGEPHQEPWTTLIHGDMYRLESYEDIEKLGWNDLLADPKNILCIEWPEKITGTIPDWAVCVVIHHMGGEKRRIEI